LDALPTVNDDQYAIVINKVRPALLKMMKAEDGKGLEKIKASLLSQLRYTTQHLYFSPFKEELHNKDNVEWRVDEELQHSIKKIPYVKVSKRTFWAKIFPWWIKKEDHIVQTIAIKDYEGMTKDMEEKMSQLQNDRDFYMAEIARLKSKMTGA